MSTGHKHCGGGECHHTHRYQGHGLRLWLRESACLALLLLCALCSHLGVLGGVAAPVAYAVALLPVGVPILRETFGEWRRGDFFNEFSLMVLACVGAFAIGEYPEGVAILLFYSLGEKLENVATERSRRRIMALLNRIPREVTVEGRGLVEPEKVLPGEIISVRPGERVGLDGVLLADAPRSFDTSAFTGESVPVEMAPGAEVPSGSIAIDRTARIRVTRPYAESSMSRILALIESAASRKSRSETLLRRITRWYTPAVMLAAALLFAVPGILAAVHGAPFYWRMWLDRSLVLLVCSCPCALVVSIPLSYFAAIGAASARGILFKSSSGLDAIRGCDTLFLDKTGTLTTGDFRVAEVFPASGVEPDRVLALAAAVDAESSHPLARAVVRKAEGLTLPEVGDIRTVPHGMSARSAEGELLVASRARLKAAGVEVPDSADPRTEVCVALVGKYLGSIYLEDTVKPGVREALADLKRLGAKDIEILSGDRPEAVAAVAKAIGADGYRGGLYPADKQKIVEEARKAGRRVIFVGDGINDAPSLAEATVGVAIGSGGTDLAMESAEAVLTAQGIEPLAPAIRLSRRVRSVVAFNVSFAVGVKLLVMLLGAMGLATLWAAVFADTGITVLTVLFTLLALRLRKN